MASVSSLGGIFYTRECKKDFRKKKVKINLIMKRENVEQFAHEAKMDKYATRYSKK